MEGSGRQARVDGDVLGRFVAGDHTVVVTAQRSVVTALRPDNRPHPKRRQHVEVLPHGTREAIGRRRELDVVTRAIANDQPAQVFCADGFGKSTLLRDAAHALTGHGDGVVYLDANGYDVDDLVQIVFEACHETSGYRPGQADLRRLLSDMRICLVVDDVSLSADMLDRLLELVPSGAVLFTSTERLLWGPGQIVQLGGLPLGESVTLIERVLGRSLPQSAHADAEALWRLTGGHPLDLVRAAAMVPDDDGTEVVLPRANEIVDIVASAAAKLDGRERDVLALFTAIGPACVSADVLSHLVAVTGPVEVARRLTALGLLTAADRGFRAATGVAKGLGDGLAPDGDRLRRFADRLTDWIGSASATPVAVAEHGALITALVEATAAGGGPGVGTRLARTAAPVVACSLRWGVWGRIVAAGRAAAELAADRDAQAYFAHEDGIRCLVGGDREAAGAAFAASVRLRRLAGPPPIDPGDGLGARAVDPGGHAATGFGGVGMTLAAKLLVGAVLVATATTGIALTQVAPSPKVPSTVPLHVRVVTDAMAVSGPGVPEGPCPVGAGTTGAGTTDCTRVSQVALGGEGAVEVVPARSLPSGVGLLYWGRREGPASRTCTVRSDRERRVCVTTSSPVDAAAQRDCRAAYERDASGATMAKLRSHTEPTR
jgi:hypothetical protein